MLARKAGLTNIVLRSASAMAVGLLLYLALGALLVRYAIDDIVLREAGSRAYPSSGETLPIRTRSGYISLRTVGSGTAGCVLIFPGQHGPNATYEASIVPALTDRGVAVYLFSYDALQRPTLERIAESASDTVAVLGNRCGANRLVVVGRSLGAMVAAYAVSATRPAGLVLDSASPRFSLAIRQQLTQRWYLRPLALLPIDLLLRHDYSLREALCGGEFVRGVIFQGTEDRRTPLRDFQQVGSIPPGMTLFPVAGANHANAYSVARKSYIRVIFAMLRVGASEIGNERASLPARRQRY